MRRRTLLVALAGLAVVVAAGVVVAWPRLIPIAPKRPGRIPAVDRVAAPAERPPNPSQASPKLVDNFRRLKRGMSRADVEAILGPPGDFSTHPTAPDYALSGNREMWEDTAGAPATMLVGVMQWRDPKGRLTATWKTDTGGIRVTFDPTERASFAEVWYTTE
jgi:hypothetical protein